MKQSVLLTTALAAITAGATPVADVDTRYPYTGPTIPVGDWVDPTVKGNGKGFPRLVEAPAVKPKSSNPTNNINVISLSYLNAGSPGMNIHFQTPFGLSEAPTVHWGEASNNLCNVANGKSKTYNREPPCSLLPVTQCSEFFHNVPIHGLKAGTKYYYQIVASNGTTESDVLSFVTSIPAGSKKEFTVGVLNDMGYTNAQGTHKQMLNALSQGDSSSPTFFWHGGDISYADDWYSGILPCESSWPVCYNGTSTELPNSPPDPIPAEYQVPLPKGELADQGGPQGGDMSVLYESNWDLWQQWMNPLTAIPYQVLPGNHEAACAEFDGPGNILTAYLNDDKSNSTAPKSNLTYYSCPPSQRNFTAFQNRFDMNGEASGGVSNFWYSFDVGLAHFISLDGETDFAKSPEYSFADDTKGKGLPTPGQTESTDSGPFGSVGSYDDNETYEQIQWLKKDLASVDRCKTKWIIAMSHRPMYSSQVSGYQKNLRNAFQDILIDGGVDMYLSGHIHWYERLLPLDRNGSIHSASVISRNEYKADPGKSLTHIINGMAGNIESHSAINSSKILNITTVLNQLDYGFSKLTIHNSTTLTWQYIKGNDGSVGDSLVLRKDKTGKKGKKVKKSQLSV